MKDTSVVIVACAYLVIHWACCENEPDGSAEEEFDWCCLKCDGPHVMCPAALEQQKLFRPEGCSLTPKNGTVVGTFSEDKLVALINNRRKKLAKNAQISNMKFLRISYKLRLLAEQLAGYCASIPSVCVDTDDYRVKVITFNVTGEQTDVSSAAVVDRWMQGRIPYLEKYHDQFYANYTSINETDDFTLLMWGSTAEIGCAEAYYDIPAVSYNDATPELWKNDTSSTNGTSPMYNSSSPTAFSAPRPFDSNSTSPLYEKSTTATSSYQITCLLGPGGNINGMPVWERGPPCSNCSTPEEWESQRTTCRDALCFVAFPRWPRDEQRLAACKFGRASHNEARVFVHDDEKPYPKAVTVVLKPRYICDPISAAGRPQSSRWNILVASSLLSMTEMKIQGLLMMLQGIRLLITEFFVQPSSKFKSCFRTSTVEVKTDPLHMVNLSTFLSEWAQVKIS